MSRLVLGLVVGSALLGGCERFSARSDVAAEVGAHQLTAERVASIMNQSGGGTPTVEAAEFISNLWLDYSLLGRAVAEDKIPTDSTDVEAMLWPTLSTIRINLLRDSVRAKRFAMTPEALEAAYNEPTYRIFQHIIVIPAGPTARDSAAARQQLTTALGRIRGGADFGQIASQLSSDGSKNDQGYLPFGPRGQFVPEFEDPAWQLAPGQVTDVITTQFGYHLIRRPAFAEARDRFQTGFGQQGLTSVDSTYQAELIAANELEVTSGAPAAIKSAVADLEKARGSSKVLVKAKSGNVTVGDFAKWGAMFNVQAKMQIRGAPDSLLTAFAKDLGLRTLLLRAADSAGINPEPQMKQFALVRYNQIVTQIETELGLAVPELSDSSTLAPEAKAKLAGEKIDAFFTKLLEGQAQMIQLPPELAAHLRGLNLGKVHQPGIARSVELATTQFKKDSAEAGARPAPGAIQQAPAGPPIEGAEPAAPPTP